MPGWSISREAGQPTYRSIYYPGLASSEEGEPFCTGVLKKRKAVGVDRSLTNINLLLTALLETAAGQHLLPAGRLEEEPSQEQKAQQKYQGVYNDFDKTHWFNYS